MNLFFLPNYYFSLSQCISAKRAKATNMAKAKEMPLVLRFWSLSPSVPGAIEGDAGTQSHRRTHAGVCVWVCAVS